MSIGTRCFASSWATTQPASPSSPPAQRLGSPGQKRRGDSAVGSVAVTSESSRMDGTFVGRRNELASLLAQAAQARDGHPRVVLVTGEPGIGKTALAHRFVSQAHGFQLLEASGEEAEQLLAFGVIEQLVRAAHSSGGPALADLERPRRRSTRPHLGGSWPPRASRHHAGVRPGPSAHRRRPVGGSPFVAGARVRPPALAGRPRAHSHGVAEWVSEGAPCRRSPPGRARPRCVGARPRPGGVLDPRPRGLHGGRSPLVAGRRPDSSSYRRQSAARDGDLRRDHPRDPSGAIRPAAAFDRRLRRAGPLAARRVYCRSPAAGGCGVGARALLPARDRGPARRAR